MGSITNNDNRDFEEKETIMPTPQERIDNLDIRIASLKKFKALWEQILDMQRNEMDAGDVATIAEAEPLRAHARTGSMVRRVQAVIENHSRLIKRTNERIAILAAAARVKEGKGTKDDLDLITARATEGLEVTE